MYKIGIDLGGTNIAAGIVTEKGEILYKKSIPTSADRPQKDILNDIIILCELLCMEHGIDWNEISSIGIAVPGGVDVEEGKIMFTPNIPFSGLMISEALSHKLHGKSVNVINDANAATLAEVSAGAAKGASNAVMITIGTGIGGGIVINGKIYTGVNGLAGEIGHMKVEEGGFHCGCGRYGCFETVASASALVHMTEQEIHICKNSGEHTIMADEKVINARTVFTAHKLHDAAAKRVLERYTDDLANGIASLINIFQPEVFVIGGGVSGQGQYLIDMLQPKVDRAVYGGYVDKKTKLCTALCGNDAGIIGAAFA